MGCKAVCCSGDGGSPCCGSPGTGPTDWGGGGGGVCSRSLTFLFVQDSNPKISAGTLGSDPWMSTVPAGQAEIIYKLSFPLLSLFMLLSLLGLFGGFFPDLTFFSYSKLVQIVSCVETNSGLSQTQYFTVTPSTFCISVFLQVHRLPCGLLKLGGVRPPALLFQSKHNRNRKAREKLRQKRYTWIGNISTYFSVVATI